MAVSEQTEGPALKIETEELDDRQVQLTIEVPENRQRGAMRAAARRLSKRDKIPGFRPGKVPFEVALGRYGEEAIFEEAIGPLGQDVYRQAIDDSELEPFAPGALNEVVSKEPLVLRFSVPLAPEVELGNYRKLRVKFKPPEVEDEAVNEMMEELRQRQALIEPADRPVQLSDVAVIDVDAVLLDGGGAAEAENDAEAEAASGEDEHKDPGEDGADDAGETELAEGEDGADDAGETELAEGEAEADDTAEADPATADDAGEPEEAEADASEAESDQGDRLLKESGISLLVDAETDWPFPGIADELVGKSAGDELTVEHTFADDYQSESLQGKTGRFHITVQDVKSRTVPEWTDDLARNVGDYEDLLDLRIKVREGLTANAEHEANSEYADEVIEQLVEKAEVAFPPYLTEQELDDLIHDLNHRLEAQGLTLEQYLQVEEKTGQELRDELRPRATERVTRALVLSQLIEDEGLEVGDDEIDQRLDETVSQLQDPEGKLRKALNTDSGRRRLRNDLLFEKGIERVAAIAKGEAPELEKAAD